MIDDKKLPHSQGEMADAPKDGTVILGYEEGLKYPRLIFWIELEEDERGAPEETGVWQYVEEFYDAPEPYRWRLIPD